MFEYIRKARQNDEGFTLIELLMVIVILGILAGVVVFAVNGIQNKGEDAACKTDVKSVTVASEAYFAQNGKYAAAIGDLSGFLHSTPGDVSYTNNGDTTEPTINGAGGTCPASVVG